MGPLLTLEGRGYSKARTSEEQRWPTSLIFPWSCCLLSLASDLQASDWLALSTWSPLAFAGGRGEAPVLSAWVARSYSGRLL